MNMLESLDTLGFLHFKKLIDLVIPKKERRQSEIIIGYIQVYTLLNNASNLLNKDNCRRAIEHLQIAKKSIEQLKFEDERPYLQRIVNILNSILKNKKEVIKVIRKGGASDPFHIKTSLRLGQNICILRVLKINKH